MSTVAYALFNSEPSTSSSGQPSGSDQPAPGNKATKDKSGWKTYAEAIVAFVPVEVIALHGIAVQLATTESDEGGSNVSTITQPDLLLWTSGVLVVLSVPLYLGIVYRKKGKTGWDGWDVLRMFFAPVAFAVWCMFQSPSVADILFSVEQNDDRIMIASIVAVVLLAIYAFAPGPESTPPAKPGTGPSVNGTHNIGAQASSENGKELSVNLANAETEDPTKI